MPRIAVTFGLPSLSKALGVGVMDCHSLVSPVLTCIGVAPQVGVMESRPSVWLVIFPYLVLCHELGVWTPTLQLGVMDSPFLLWLLGLGLCNLPFCCGLPSKECVLQGFCVPLQDSCAWVCHLEWESRAPTLECGPSSCSYGLLHSNVTFTHLSFGVGHGVGIMDSHFGVVVMDCKPPPPSSPWCHELGLWTHTHTLRFVPSS